MYVAEATKGAVIVFVGSVLVCMRMALVRERAMVYGGGFDAEAFGGGFESSQMGYGHDALLDIDAAALFGGYEAAASAGCALVQDGAAGWAGAGASSSVLAFDRAAQAEEAECDAWIEAMDQSYGAGGEAAPYRSTTAVAFDAATGCFSLTERATGGGGGAGGRQFGLLFPSTSGGGVSPERAAPAPAPRGSQKRAHAESSQAMSPSKKQCGAGRKAGKAKSAPTTPTKDPQSLAAKVIKLLLNSAPKSYCYSDQSMYRTELELFLPAAESAREDQRAAADPAGARAQRHQGRPRHHAREGHQLRQVPPASSQGMHTSLAMCTRLRG